MAREQRSFREEANLFRIKLGHLAELVVTAVKELLHRLVSQLVKMLQKDLIHHRGCGIVVQRLSGSEMNLIISCWSLRFSLVVLM